MPIFYDRVADQIEELLPEFYQTDGPRFVSFIKAYFEFLEKGQLIYKDAADIDYIGLEDGTVVGEAFNADGQRGNLLQEDTTYAPSSIPSAKFNFEHDVDTQDRPIIAKTSFEKDEYVVGASTGAVGRIDVIGSSSNLYIEQFSEAQFDIDETITGMTSGMEAKVASFKASPLHAVNNLLSYADIDKTSGDFMEYFRRDFMPFIDRDILANKRLLQKHVKELYLSKGTKESYEFLFRILYGEEAEVVYPGDNVIKPSESEFSEPTVMRLYSTHDITKYKRGSIKKYTGSNITTQAYINDASGMSGTNDSANAYELELVTPFTGTFSPGDSVIISDRDGFRIDATATVRGVMSDIDPDESSIYVGLEDGVRGDNEDVIRLEDYTPIYILDENDNNILMEDESQLIFEHALGGESYQARAFELETGTGAGILLTEESDYDINGNLVSDYAVINETTDLYDASLDPLWRTGPATRRFGGGVYQEQASLGSLYSESDTFNYKTPVGGVATSSINVIGGIGRGGITDIIIDDAGSGYAEGDQLVFVNSGTEGENAEAQVKTIRAFVSLEAGTLNEHTIYSYTATASQTVFSGRDNAGLIMGFDPRKVKVYVNGTEKTRETQFTTDQSGGKITLTSGVSANDLVEVYAAFQGIRLEDADNPNPHYQSGHPNNNYLTQEVDGTISKIQITHPGENYKSLPQVYMGGFIYYDTMTTGTAFSAGNILTSTNSKTVVVVKHDLEKKRILVYKRPTDPAGVPSGTISVGSGASLISCTILQTNVTAGSGTKLWAYGDNIGSVKKLKMQDIGHNFVQGGIGNYKQHAVIKDISNTLTATTTVTANLTGATGTIDRFNGNLNIVTLKDVKGIFNDGDYCTTSDSKNFIIGKINPCTARGKLAGTALYDGNYLNDIGFPSVTSMRIHDSHQYQDFSYMIKVGKSINEYRSLVKSLLSPAGTIMFGEVSIRNRIDATGSMYGARGISTPDETGGRLAGSAFFDSTQTSRSFIPTLIIGSKIDTADIELETATIGIEDDVFGSGMGRIELEDDSGVLSTQRFICTDTTAADHSSHTVQDQSSGQRIYIPDIVDPIVETDKDFFERVLTAEARAKGNKVTKELDISPHWNQHKISYGTLNNALAVGTKVRGATSNALGIVMQHDTTNKFIIVHRDNHDHGQAGSEFTGTEIIQNTAASTNYFTATSIELHWIPEDITTKQDPASITADSYITSQAQKTATEGGGEPYDHTQDAHGNPRPVSVSIVYMANQDNTGNVHDRILMEDNSIIQWEQQTVKNFGYVGGWFGRGKVLTANDRNEFYDSDMRQRKVNIISSPLFTQARTQRGRAYSASVAQLRTLNIQNSRTLGSNTTANNSNGSALRIDSAFNTHDGSNISFGHRPAGQKLFETTNFLSERIISETQDPIVMELDHGQILGEDFSQGGAVILEDENNLMWEDATVVDETHYFVSEESTQVGSFNIISESNERLIDETDSLPLLHEQALMVGMKESNQSGPSIGDLGDMMFTENYSIMNKVYEENFYILDETDGDNILIEDDTYGGNEVFSLVSESEEIVLETGEHLLQESPSEGLRINDISTIYPNRFVSNLQRELGRRTNLNHSAVIQTG